MWRRSIPLLWTALLLCLPALSIGAQPGQFPDRSSRLDPSGAGGQARQELHHIADDEQRSYWLITPAVGRARYHNFNPVGDWMPRSLQPGLIVALGAEGSGQDALDFWTNAEDKVFHGRYLIAVPVAPSWSRETPTPWLTRSNLRSIPQATFATEDFLTDIVKDVCSSHALNPDHIYLHGVGISGPIVYTCSLDVQTPFKGFYILSSAFRSLQLPPLTRAHGRRYLIQHSAEDKNSPLWMAQAAQKLLTEKGATVKLDTLHAGHGYSTPDALWKHVQSAITWLETGK